MVLIVLPPDLDKSSKIIIMAITIISKTDWAGRVQSKILDVVLDKYDPVLAKSSYGLFVKFIRVSSFFCQWSNNMTYNLHLYWSR